MDLLVWMESVAARAAAVLGDITSVSLGAVPAAFALFLGIWLSSAEDYALRPVLAVATTVALLSTCLAWFAKAIHSKLSHSVAILLHALSIAGVASMMFLVVIAAVYQDTVRSSVREELAAKAVSDEEVARKAAEQVQEMHALLDTVKRELAAKDEAAKEAERAAVQLAETRCLKVREDAQEKAKGAYASALRAAEDCRIEFNGQLVRFKSFQEQCETALARLSAARAQVKEAKSKTCEVLER